MKFEFKKEEKEGRRFYRLAGAYLLLYFRYRFYKKGAKLNNNM